MQNPGSSPNIDQKILPNTLLVSSSDDSIAALYEFPEETLSETYFYQGVGKDGNKCYSEMALMPQENGRNMFFCVPLEERCLESIIQRDSDLLESRLSYLKTKGQRKGEARLQRRVESSPTSSATPDEFKGLVPMNILNEKLDRNDDYCLSKTETENGNELSGQSLSHPSEQTIAHKSSISDVNKSTSLYIDKPISILKNEAKGESTQFQPAKEHSEKKRPNILSRYTHENDDATSVSLIMSLFDAKICVLIFLSIILVKFEFFLNI